MAKLPVMDLTELISLVRREGRSEIAKAKPKNASGVADAMGVERLLKEVDNILDVLEKEVAPLLKKGCEPAELGPAIAKIGKSGRALSLMAPQVLSFVPGPIGIICSLINAIVCFSIGDVFGGLMELMGCIPGGKVAAKSSSKLFPLFQRRFLRMIDKSSDLKYMLKSKESGKVINGIPNSIYDLSGPIKPAPRPHIPQRPIPQSPRPQYGGGTNMGGGMNPFGLW